MKSDDDSNTLERFFEEPDELIESSEPTEPPESAESIDEKTDYSSGLYETILSWEQHSGLQLVHSVFHDMIPIRSVRDRESGSVRPPKHELESFQHWTDKEFYDKKFDSIRNHYSLIKSIERSLIFLQEMFSSRLIWMNTKMYQE